VNATSSDPAAPIIRCTPLPFHIPRFGSQEETLSGRLLRVWAHGPLQDTSIVVDYRSAGGLDHPDQRSGSRGFLHAVGAVDDATSLGYLDLGYRLGRQFATDRDSAEAALA
jgi:hypothetical protein